MILPLTAALAIAVFSAGTYGAAASWRGSEAATMVGADLAYRVRVPLAQAVPITHELDPAGRWLMAVGANADSRGPKVIVDAPRLARIAAWPDSWTPGVSVAQVAKELAPLRPRLTLAGRRLQMTVDNDVRSDVGKLLLAIEVITSTGQPSSVFVGPYPQGRSTRSASMSACVGGCQVVGLTVSGPGTLAQVMRGALTISRVRTDSGPLPYFARIGWRGKTDPVYVYGRRSVSRIDLAGSALRVVLDSRGRQAVAMLTPQDVPRVLPVLLGRTADLDVTARDENALTLATSSGPDARVHPIGTSESMPFFGPAGMLVDHTMYSRTHTVYDIDTQVYILARSDTPQTVLDRLGAYGINQPVSLAEVRTTLEQDAYALALKLYRVVTLVVLLLALAGLAVNMAVQIPARRRDAASLRVVGLRRRSILTSVSSELTAVLGAAAIAGILAGALAQYVVVRTVTLGYANDFASPRVLPSLDLTAVVGLLAITLAILLGVAVVLGALTIRGARGSTLRESAG